MQDITEFEIRLFNENSERISTTAGYEPFYILNKTDDLCFIQDDTKVQVHTITGQILCSCTNKIMTYLLLMQCCFSEPKKKIIRYRDVYE